MLRGGIIFKYEVHFSEPEERLKTHKLFLSSITTTYSALSVSSLRSSGECHAGTSSLHHYDRYGKGRGIGTDLNDCNDRKFCAGKEFRNMVYKIVGKNG